MEEKTEGLKIIKEEAVSDKNREFIKGELVLEDNNDKTVFHFVNTEYEIDFLTKTVLKKEDKTVYHLLKREWGGKKVISRYTTIKRIILEGLSNKLPGGFSQTPSKGYAPTGLLKPLMKFIDENSGVEEIILSKKKNTLLAGKQLILNLNDLEDFRKNTSSLTKIMNEKNRAFTQNYFAERFPKYFSKTEERYQRGTLYRLLSQYQNIDKKISPDDKNALIRLFKKLSISERKMLKRQDLILQMEENEKKMMSDVLDEFENLISLKRIKEQRWQNFFKKNAWIFSQLFAHPAVLFKDEAYVGGKTILDENGKYVDFLYAKSLTKNSALIEIKTHTTKLLASKPYRGKNVYHMEKDLSGAIAQILDQKSVYLKEFYETTKGTDLGAFDPKCILIIGRFSDLNKYQQECFELLRAGLKDVEIITFDELLTKIKSILSIFKSDLNEEKEKIGQIEKIVKKSVKKKNG
ncbi:MAG: Shedu immune nuclease family protein [Candidatus Pacearchaeota archaeon]